MQKEKSNFDKLKDLFLELHDLEQFYFGSYSRAKHNIVLYDVENKPEVITRLRRFVEKVTKKYNLIIWNKEGETSNVTIADIDL